MDGMRRTRQSVVKYYYDMSPETDRRFVPIDFKTRFPALDGIRALAVTMVFVHHYGGGAHAGTVLHLLDMVRQPCWAGVDLFFVLSGFLITGILYDTRSDSHYFKRFFLRRAVRILPVFYVVATLLLLLTPVFRYQWSWMYLSWPAYVGNMFGNYNWTYYSVVSANHPAATVEISHFWSLCVEEQFYLLWPIGVLLIRNRTVLLRTAVGLSILALGLRIAMFMHFSAAFATVWVVRTLPFRMDSLLIGGIMALLLRGPEADRWQRSGKWFFLAGLAATLGLFYCSPAYDSVWVHTIGFTFIAVTSAGLICSTLRRESSAFHFFRLKPLRILGKYSYGFYIFHLLFRPAWIQILFAEARTHNLALVGVLALGSNFLITFMASKISYDLIESRWLRLKRRFEYDSEAIAQKDLSTPCSAG
jgi:peptidoglycan/LPS O-acetylase OafA/YrhL